MEFLEILTVAEILLVPRTEGGKEGQNEGIKEMLLVPLAVEAVGPVGGGCVRRGGVEEEEGRRLGEGAAEGCEGACVEREGGSVGPERERESEREGGREGGREGERERGDAAAVLRGTYCASAGSVCSNSRLAGLLVRAATDLSVPARVSRAARGAVRRLAALYARLSLEFATTAGRAGGGVSAARAVGMPLCLPVCRPLIDEDDEGEDGEEDEGGGVREHCRGEEVEEEEDADRDGEGDGGRGKEGEGERGARQSTKGNNHTNNNNYNREPPLLSFSRLIVRALVGEYLSSYYCK